MRYVLIALILFHGLIHLMGFSKAFGYAALKQLSLPVSKPAGLLWLLATVFFLTAVILIALSSRYWTPVLITACVLSQLLIILSWKEARFGTLVNIVLLAIAILSLTSQYFEQTFKKEAFELLRQPDPAKGQLLTEADTRHLPEIVQRYLQYSGVMNRPKVYNMRVVFDGQMREKGKSFFSFSSEQYNFFENPARLFFIKAAMYGIMVPGYHHYRDATARMDIRLFGEIPVVRESGTVMDTTETVTLFNDMCLLAPATLIDPRINWIYADTLSVWAEFLHEGIRIRALLSFNEKGQLVNFISQDRTAIADRKKYPFSTPVKKYRQLNGYNLMSEADAVWDYPDGKFVYGKFRLRDIQYNYKEPD